MARTTIPQQHCPSTYDHKDHLWGPRYAGQRLRSTTYRCPGRHTPRLHGGISGDPVQPSDPFAGTGADDDREF